MVVCINGRESVAQFEIIDDVDNVNIKLSKDVSDEIRYLLMLHNIPLAIQKRATITIDPQCNASIFIKIEE